MTSIEKKIQYKAYSHHKFKDVRREVKRFLDLDEEILRLGYERDIIKKCGK